MRTREKEKSNVFKKIVIVALFIIAVAVVINLAPNFVTNNPNNKISIIKETDMRKWILLALLVLTTSVQAQEAYNKLRQKAKATVCAKQ